MIFRKDALLFYQCQLLCIFMALLAFTLIPVLGLWLSLLYMLPFIVLIFANPKLHCEFIKIDETGICCLKSGKKLWGYKWENVAEIKKSSRFLMPSIEVIACNKYGEPERCAQSNHYFQLSRVARKAVKQYYTGKSGSSVVPSHGED